MPTLHQVHLLAAREPLQISYPSDYQGNKSVESDDDEFFISTLPLWLTPGEIELVEQQVDKLPYRQSLIRTGAMLIDEDDPLLDASHEELDRLEESANLSNTRNALRGGERTTRERVYIIRESGYTNGRFRELPASK